MLVECADVQDGDTGSRYTIKEYESIKAGDHGAWRHQKIYLKPRSTNLDIPTLELRVDDDHRYRVAVEFLRVLDCAGVGGRVAPTAEQ